MAETTIQKRNTGTVKELISSDYFREQVAKALPRHLKPDRFTRVALTALIRIPKLAECSQSSLLSALLTLSEMGLEPDGRRAHLIPYKNNKSGTVDCQLIIDYKGLVELVMRSGEVSHIHCDIVCDQDVFEYDMGEIKAHKIDFRQPRGDMYAVYAIARLKDGNRACQILSKAEVDAIRARSRAGEYGPWVTDYAEMAKKTAFRRLSKWLPLSPELRDRIEADDDLEPIQKPRTEKPVFDLSTPEMLPEPAATTPKANPDEQAEADMGLAPAPAPEPTGDPDWKVKGGRKPKAELFANPTENQVKD